MSDSCTFHLNLTCCNVTNHCQRASFPLIHDMFHLRETNVRQKIAQLIFSLHKDIVFYQVVIPYKGQFKNLEYTIKCAILHLEKKKTNRQSQFVAIV